MRVRWGVILVVGCVSAFDGCATPCDEVVKENAGLNKQLGQVTVDLLGCQTRLKEITNLNNVLVNEKRFKDDDLSRLREVYRGYISAQYQTLDGLLNNVELLDYFGGEVIAREKDQGSNVTLVLQQPVPANGRILRVRANVFYKTQFHLLVFKLLEKELLCVYASDPLDIDDVGTSEMVDLPVPVHIQKGDILGFYFPEKIGVFYDENTGNYSVFKSPGRIGERIKLSKADSEKRNYSLGVLTVLE